MKILLHGLNFAPEELGIGKYSGEMVEALVEAGHDVVVVTTPPYYPAWKIGAGYSGWRWRGEVFSSPSSVHRLRKSSEGVFDTDNCELSTENVPHLAVFRCPLWVPGRVSGIKRILHLASFALSSVPVVLWQAVRFRPDVVMTVEPAAMCMPTSWFAARLCGAKAWLHIQDFEVDAAFELGILKHPTAKRIMLAVEGWWMRRFDRVSSISPNMLFKAAQKGVAEDRLAYFPNWVDCDVIRPAEAEEVVSSQFTVYSSEPDSLTGNCELKTENSLPSSLRASFGLPPDRFIGLYAGNLGAKQGLEILLQAAERLEQSPDVLIVICGDGAAAAAVHDAAVGLDNVVLLPVQPADRLGDLLGCADVHLLPQRTGAADLVMPSKLTGMLASGRPVIACADGGTQIADVVTGKGIVAPPGDAGAVADAMIELAGDRPRCLTLGAEARRYAVEHLDRRAILGRWIEQLHAVCDDSKQTSAGCR